MHNEGHPFKKKFQTSKKKKKKSDTAENLPSSEYT